MTAFWEDQEFVEEVRRLVDAKIADMGYPIPAYSFLEMRIRIKKSPGDWGEAETKNGYIKDFAKAAKKKLDQAGVKPRSNLRGSPTDLISYSPVNSDIATNVGMMWATIDPTISHCPDILNDVRKLRRETWGKDEPPFDNVDLGQQQADISAHEWLTMNLEEDQKSHSKFYKYEIKLRFNCLISRVRNISLSMSEVGQLSSFLRESQKHIYDYKPVETLNIIDKLKQIIENEQMSLDCLSVEPFKREAITIPGGKIDNHTVGEDVLSVGNFGKVRELLDKSDAIAKKTGWWKNYQALSFVLTGIPPTPFMGYSGAHRSKLTPFSIDSLGPIKEEEVIRLYREACKRFGWKAPNFTANDLALLEIHARAPGDNWPALHARWEGWRELHPELTDFTKSNPRRASDKMRTAWERASKKINWQRRGVP